MLLLIISLNILMNFNRTPQPNFEAQTIDNNISIGYGLALGDVDGDGKPDILLADKKQFVWYRNGDWKKFLMVENLTMNDNVCITATDINGDGKVEVAVGAQWNPSETSNAEQSGGVYYLIRPQDPTQLWKAVRLYHEPTIHRMGWFKSSDGRYYLIVVPLHGRGNVGGEGEGVNVLAYKFPADVNSEWTTYKSGSNMHLTHNFEIIKSKDEKKNGLYLAGKEGIRFMPEDFIKTSKGEAEKLTGMDSAAGEVRIGKTVLKKNFIATIEPMHGQEVVVYMKDDESKRIVIDGDLKEGHALATADFLGIGSDQIVAGWRSPNKEGKIGIKLYIEKNTMGTEWESNWIDENGMACEDIKVMDLNGDGKQDIVASGRSTHNLKIYWNKSGK